MKKFLDRLTSVTLFLIVFSFLFSSYGEVFAFVNNSSGQEYIQVAQNTSNKSKKKSSSKKKKSNTKKKSSNKKKRTVSKNKKNSSKKSTRKRTTKKTNKNNKNRKTTKKNTKKAVAKKNNKNKKSGKGKAIAAGVGAAAIAGGAQQVSGEMLISPNNLKVVNDNKSIKDIVNMNEIFPTAAELKGGIEKWITTDAKAVKDDTCELFEKRYFYYSLDKEKIMDIERNNTYFVNSRMFQCNNTSTAYELYKKFFQNSREKVHPRFFTTIPFGNESFVVMLPLLDENGKRIKTQHADYYVTYIMRNFILQINSDDGFAVMEVASKIENKLGEYLKYHNTNILLNKLNLQIKYKDLSFSDNVSFSGNNVDKVRLRGNIYDKDGKRLKNTTISSIETGQSAISNDYGEYVLDVGFDNGTSITVNKDIYLPYADKKEDNPEFTSGKYYFNVVANNKNKVILGIIDITLNKDVIYGRLIDLDDYSEYFVQGKIKHYLVRDKALLKKDRKTEIAYEDVVKNLDNGSYIYDYALKRCILRHKISAKEKLTKNQSTEVSDEMLNSDNLSALLDNMEIDFDSFENNKGKIVHMKEILEKKVIRKEVELDVKVPGANKDSKESTFKFIGVFDNESEVNGFFKSNKKGYKKGTFNINKNNFKVVKEKSLAVDKGINISNASFKNKKLIVDKKEEFYQLYSSNIRKSKKFINLSLFNFNREDIFLFEKGRVFLKVLDAKISDNAYIVFHKKTLDFYGKDTLEKTIFKQSIPRHLNKKYILDITDIIKHVKSNDIYIELASKSGDFINFSNEDVEVEFDYYRDTEGYKETQVITAELLSLNSPDLVSNSSRILADGNNDFTVGLRIIGRGRVIENIEIEGMASIKRKWNTNIEDIYPAIAVTDSDGKVLNNNDTSLNIKLRNQDNRFILYLYKGSLSKGNIKNLNMKITISGKVYSVPIEIK